MCFFRKWYGFLMDKKKLDQVGMKKTHIKRIQLNIHEVHQIYIYIHDTFGTILRYFPSSGGEDVLFTNSSTKQIMTSQLATT